MNCPKCGTEGAYVGLVKIECQSSSCEHYVAPKEEFAPKVKHYGLCGDVKFDGNLITESFSTIPLHGIVSSTFTNPRVDHKFISMVTSPLRPMPPFPDSRLTITPGISLVPLISFTEFGDVYVRGAQMGTGRLDMCRRFIAQYTNTAGNDAEIYPLYGGSVQFIHHQHGVVLELYDKDRVYCPKHFGSLGGSVGDLDVYAVLMYWMRDAGCL